MTGNSPHCILLAAGAGTRFRDPDRDDSHKLLAALPPSDARPAETVVERSLASLLAADLGDVTVVTGALDEDDFARAAATPTSPLRHQSVRYIHNPDWASGQAGSVQIGIDAARQLGADVAVIGLGDQPGVTSTAWQAVAAAGHAGAPIAVATYANRRGNPVGLHRDVWDLVAEHGDEGARSLMALRGDLVVPVSCQGQPDDIDTVEDLHTWQSN